MKSLVKIQYGSKLYGTNLPTSDDDYKVVFLPDRNDILLQNCSKISNVTKSNGNVDIEKFPLHVFCEYALKSIPVNFEMLFADSKNILETSEEWKFLVSNREKFLSKNVAPFVGYCRSQANKYSMKVETVKQIEFFLELAEGFNPKDRLAVMEQSIQFHVDQENFPPDIFVNKTLANGHVIKHIKIGNTFVPLTARVSDAKKTYSKMHSEYGERTKSFVKGQFNHDWKALYHAVRISNQTIELLKTKHITFPRPESQLLLNIRQGLVAYEAVSDILDENMNLIEQNLLTTSLPDKPDKEFIYNFIINAYLRCVESKG